VTYVGGKVAATISATPLRFVSPRDVGAVVAGAFALALTGAVLIGLWDYFSGSPDGWRNFRVWLLSNFVAIVLLAPFIASWAQLELNRVPARRLFSFAGGIVACALFVICVHTVFSMHRAGGTSNPFAMGLTYLPLVLFVLVAWLWNARGVTLAALVGALMAITQTIRGFGPFIGAAGFFDDPVLNAQGYAVVLTIAGLLVTTLAKDRRPAS
jgi:MFS family permease